MRDDHRARLSQIFIPATVIAMPVGVDDEFDRVGIDAVHRGQYLGGERSKLIIDQNVSVLAKTEADIAARPEQDRDARRQPLDLDFDLGHVLLRCGGSGTDHRGGEKQNRTAHRLRLHEV